MSSEIAIAIRNFDYTHGIMVLPPHAVWYRGYDNTKPTLSHNPMFFGDIEVALLYTRGSANRNLGEFAPTKSLRLLDIRYIISIIPYMLQKKYNNPIITKATVTLGLCSFNKQIELLEAMAAPSYPDLQKSIQRMRDFAAIVDIDKPGWVNPVELQGVRAGITDIDYEVMMWLKDLFWPIVDGIIAPHIPTPFHDQIYPDVARSCMMGELILFDPIASIKHTIDRPLVLHYYHPTMSMQNLVEVNFRDIAFNRGISINPIRLSQIVGGKATELPLVRDAMGDRLTTDPEFNKQFNKVRKTWSKMVEKIKKSQQFLQKICITFCHLEPEGGRGEGD